MVAATKKRGEVKCNTVFGCEDQSAVATRSWTSRKDSLGGVTNIGMQFVGCNRYRLVLDGGAIFCGWRLFHFITCMGHPSWCSCPTDHLLIHLIHASATKPLRENEGQFEKCHISALLLTAVENWWISDGDNLLLSPTRSRFPKGLTDSRPLLHHTRRAWTA